MSLFDVDPATGEIGVRTTIVFVDEKTAKELEAGSKKYHIKSILSHEGVEHDRILTPSGQPYLDLFGMYVYQTTLLESNINARKDEDRRYDLRKPVPWALEEDNFRDQFNIARRSAFDGFVAELYRT